MYAKKNNFRLFESSVVRVCEEWIDYNGHMNVAYYPLAFDKALDDFLEKNLEIGPTYVKKKKKGPYSLQANYNYLDELRLMDEFFTKIYLINADKKKIHLVLEMINFNTNRQVAVCETLLINVDLIMRKSVEYDVDVINRIEDYKKNCERFSWPIQIGKEIKIRKK